MTPVEAFGDILVRVRVYKRLTEEELAVRAGIPLSRIMRFENGMTEPTLSELFLLGRALNARSASLVEGVEMIVNGALHGLRRNGDGREPPSPPQSSSSTPPTP